MGRIDGPLSIPVNIDYSIEFIRPGAQTHTFEEYWHSQGHPGPCEVSYNLYGDAAAFSRVEGTFVHIEPVAIAE